MNKIQKRKHRRKYVDERMQYHAYCDYFILKRSHYAKTSQKRGIHLLGISRDRIADAVRQCPNCIYVYL
jgi:hypothetical protein